MARWPHLFSLVYSAGDDVHELLADAQALYGRQEAGLNVLAFPSIGTGCSTTSSATPPASWAPTTRPRAVRSRATYAWAAPRACCRR